MVLGAILIALAAPATSIRIKYTPQETALAAARLAKRGVEPMVNTLADEVTLVPDTRAESLKKYLESKNSPLVNSAETFIAVADEYGFNWKLLPAIAGVESNFGKVQLTNSFNPFGWGGGYIYFESFDESIRTVGQKLWSDIPAKLGPTYCPPNYSYWISGVEQFMGEIEAVEI